MKYLIRQSLYAAWHWYAKPLYDRTEEQEQQEREKFIKVLRKEESESNNAINLGINFENAVESLACNLTDKEWHLEGEELKCAEKCAGYLKDGVFQVYGKKELPSGNCLEGTADCIKLIFIADTKRKSSPYEMGEYQKSIQHWGYMYIWDRGRFDYLICDGSPDPFVETYIWEENSLALLESRIFEMIVSINSDPEIAQIFAEKWEYKGE
jgi:hypothetical protein